MSLSVFCLINVKMDNTQNKFLETRIEILDVYNMMDPDYERELYKWFFSLAFLTSHHYPLLKTLNRKALEYESGFDSQ